ncbi:MAG: GFA family protein [Opitutaceae bacterium]
MPSTLIHGGCACSAIRYEASGPVYFQTNCHCANCRRAIGAQTVAWIVVDRAGFRIISGQPTRYRTDTGAWRSFCGRCGTSLTYESDNRPDRVDITTGSLDDPESFPPLDDTHADEKLSWVPLVENPAEDVEAPSN